MRKYMADSTGNCLQCCLAAIFDYPLERIPSAYYFEVDEAGWYSAFYTWCRDKMGHIPVVVTDDTCDDLLHIEVIETEGGVAHALVARGTVVIHNPDSTRAVTDKRQTKYRILFVPVGMGVQRRTPLEEE